MHKILGIKRYSPDLEFWENLKRKKISYSTLYQIISSYKGFEGVEAFWQQCDEKVQPQAKDVTILHILSEDDLENTFHEKLSFFGYDYGVCEEDWTLFSSIFNEILFGRVSELTESFHKLNINLLFDDLSQVNHFSKKHKELFEQGKDIELPKDMKPYAIWGRSSGNCNNSTHV